MTTFFFSFVVLGTLGGLYVWARRRAAAIRRLAQEREQAALALMLGGRGAAADVDDDVTDAERRAIGRLLDEPAHAPRAAPAPLGDAQPTMPPIEYARNQPSAAEQAAAGLDPIEDLISQIMVDEPPPVRRASTPEIAAAPAPVAAPVPGNGAASPKAPLAANVPLRELALAWYEARGYRQSPASPAVWPIELVLRHREDAARAYAFVVQNDHVSVDRITALIDQAREIGMMRVAVIAEAGYERGAKDIARKRNVRLIDRRTMDAELAELQLATAAKIIAVAQTRASAESSPAV